MLSNDTVGRVTILSGAVGCSSGRYKAYVVAVPPSSNVYVSLDGATFGAAGS